MPATDWEAADRAELYVRSDLPAPVRTCRQRTTSRLSDLVADGVLAGFDVTSWAKRVPLDADGEGGQFERDLYRSFRAWAREAGVELRPFFDTRECYSSETARRRTELVMPAVCLALYADEDLVAVVPHATEAGAVSVGDCLRALAADRSEDRSPTATTAG